MKPKIPCPRCGSVELGITFVDPDDFDCIWQVCRSSKWAEREGLMSIGEALEILETADCTLDVRGDVGSRWLGSPHRFSGYKNSLIEKHHPDCLEAARILERIYGKGDNAKTIREDYNDWLESRYREVCEREDS